MFKRTIPTSASLYIVLLGLISALPPLAIDMGLPGLPQIQTEFQSYSAAYILTFFLFGFSIGPIIFGPLSDIYGRKPILLLGLALFSASAIGCSLASSMHTLLILRLIQGIGAGAAAALPSAIVRDVFTGNMALKRQSYVAMVNGMAPLIAPIIGAVVLMIGNWRAIYEVLAIFGLMLFIFCYLSYSETAPPFIKSSKNHKTLSSIFMSYLEVLTNRTYIFSTILLALAFGSMFSYIVSSSTVFMVELGSSATLYGFLFAFTALGGILGAAFNVRFALKIRAERLLKIAIYSSFLVSLGLCLIAWLDQISVINCALLILINNFFIGIILPNTTVRALQDMGNVAGSAAALQRSLQMTIGAFAGVLVSLVEMGPSFSMAISMIFFSLLSIVILFIEARSKRSEKFNIL